MITTQQLTAADPTLDRRAVEAIARATYAVWTNQECRNVAAALAVVAEQAQDPAVRHWAAGNHPQVVLELLEGDFRQRAETERRALGR